MATSGPETSQSADGGQESSTAQQALSGAPKPAMPSHGEESAFDLSSYDPLQAHAFQLTASAGLTNMNFAAPVPAPAMAPATATTTTAQAPQQGVVNQSYQPLAPPVPAPIYTTQAQPPQSAPTQIYYVQQTQQPQQPPQQPPQHTQQPPHPLVYPGLLTGSTQQSLAPSQQALPAPVPAPPAPQPVQHVAPSQPHRELHQQQQVVLAPLQPAPLHPSPQYYLPNQTTQVAQPAPYNGQQTAPAPVAQHSVQAAAVGIPVAGGLKRPSPGDAAAGPPQKKPQLVYPSMQLPSVSTSSGSETTPVSVQSSLNHDLGGDVDPINRKPPPNYAQMSAEEKRRYDRNLREQQRSFKISQQIKELRNVLAESNIPFKPNKFSILLSVVEYIKQLQSRAIMLDAEHRKLIATVKQTSELVNSGHTPEEDSSSNDKRGQNIGNDADMLFVQDLNYKGVFDQCTAALSVAALDGRILACNNEFAAVSGFSRQQLLRQSVFNLMQNHEEVFKAMGAMLSGSEQACNGGLKGSKDAPLYWSGVVNQQNQNVSWNGHAFLPRLFLFSTNLTSCLLQLCMNITLTRTAEGLPKFFNCALTST